MVPLFASEWVSSVVLSFWGDLNGASIIYFILSFLDFLGEKVFIFLLFSFWHQKSEFQRQKQFE